MINEGCIYYQHAMFGDPRSKSAENSRFARIARTSRRARVRVVRDISRQKYRQMYDKLESLHFKFCENRTKTL